MSYGVFTELEKLRKKREENGTGNSKETLTPIIQNTGYGVFDELQKLQQNKEESRAFSISKLNEAEKSAATVIIGGGTSSEDDDIAPVKEEEESWFQKGALKDGFSLKNIGKAILGTAADAFEDVGAGIIGMGEKALDAAMMIAPYIAQGQFYQNGGVYAPIETRQAFDQSIETAKAETAKFVANDLYDETKVAQSIVSNPLKKAGLDVEESSVFDTKMDSLAQSGGQLLGTAALQAVGVPWWLTTGATAFGGETESALKQGATMEEAAISGMISAGAEILTEKISGGIKFGGQALDDGLSSVLSRAISDKVVRNLVNIGVDAAGEGFEEVLSGAISAVGQKLTYMDEEKLSELFSSEDAMDAFIGGAILGSVSSSVGSIKGAKTGTDAVSGLTTNEESVVRKEYENRLAEAEKDGKLTFKQKNDLYNRVVEEMDKGYISTDTIEEVLGGETYKTYQDTVKSEDSLIEQEKTLTEEYNTLNKMVNEKMTGEQQVRRDELRGMLPELRQKIEDMKTNSTRDQLKTKLGEEVQSLVKDSRLMESYNEVGRRRQAFEADLTKYDAKQQEVIKKAVESGILNNTNRTHEFVDFIAKVSADKGVLFDFTNNAKLKESGFAVDGKFVNGYITQDGVTINIQSAKSLNSVVGHEVTHVLEGTAFYTELQSAVTEYAKAKGEYQSRYDAIAKLYENIEGANIDAELTADLVGDYLFTDSDFISKLSTENRNVFQKIYDEVKYLLKTATAGSKEAQQLEKVKRAFEKAYRETKNTAENSGVKYSLNAFEQDGRRYVEIDQDQSRFDGHSIEEFPRIAKEIINEKFNGRVIGIDNKMFVNGAGRDEFSNPSKRLPDDLYEAKMRTSGELDNLLDAGTNFRNAPDGADGHHHKDVVGGFDYFDTLFKIGDRYFEAVINIKNVAKGKLFKDVTKIKDVTQDIMSSYGENPKSQFLRTSSMDIVNELEGNVNTQYSLSGDTKTKEISLEERLTGDSLLDAQDLIAEIEDVAEVSPNGYVTVYHRTTEANAKRIIESGKMSAKEDGIFFSTQKDGEYSSDYGKGVVTLKVPVEKLVLDDIFDTEAHLRIPLKNRNQVLDVSAYIFEPGAADTKQSLSALGETPRRYGDYNVYGKDVALETDEDVAPVVENAALVEENDTIATESSVEELFPDDTAALQEEYEQLVAQRDDILGAVSIFEAVGDTANAEKMMADLEAVETRIAEIEADESDRLASIEEADEPVRMDSTPEDVADNVPLTKTMVAELAKDIRSKLGLPAKRVAEVRDLIARYSAEEFPSRAHLYAEIYDRFGTFTESYVDEDLKGVKALLRTYGISVDESIKRDIADYGQLMRSNFGKVRFSKDGLPVDVAYIEFQEVMPGLFPESIDVPADQLLRIIEVANMETTVAQEQNIDSDTLVEVTDLIANRVTEFKQARKETLANKHGRESFQSLMEDADHYVPPVKTNTAAPTRTEMTASPDDIAPVFDTESGQQALMPEPETEAEAPKAITRKELHENIVDDITTTFRENGYEFTEVLKKAKDLSTFATVDNTPQRVMEKALGYKEGQILADMTVNKVAQNETEGIKWLNSFTDKKDGLLAKISKQYHIKPGSKQSAAAQMYAEGFYVGENDAIIAYGDAELAKDFPDAKVQENIKGLARDPRIRMIYDETLAAINESRTRNAYPEIPRLDNYFLHFRAMEDTFSRLGLPFNPNDIRAKDLPTDLNGVTADLKPGQPYFASAMHRKGKRTSFDLLGGLENYLTSAKNQIYHIDDIQTLRALRNYIAETYGQAHGLENLDTMSDEEAEQRIEEVYNSHLSTFAKFLNEEANVLAGKTSLIDRGLEGVIGRRGMTFMDTLNRQVGANMVGFNVSSSLTNFLAPVQAFAKTNKFDFVKAMAQTAANKIGSIVGRGDNFTQESPVMIRRKGAERFYRTPYQKVADTGYVFMSMVDDLSTELIARTKYNEFTRKGMDSQQAHIETDKWVSRLMGDRSLGQQPQIYNSKTLGLITKFQLEVRNQLDSQFYDTIQEAKVSTEQIENKLLRNAKKAAIITSTFAQLAVMQRLFGKAFESIAGYNPAFDIIDVLIKTFGWDDEEDDEDTVLDNIEEGFMALLGDLPYTSTLTGGRIPIASALPVTELVKGVDQYGNEKSRWDTIKEAAPYYFLPGGYGQIKKTVAGLNMFSDEHPVAGSYTDSGNLRFPVEDTMRNRAQAGLFGQWASENARDYFDNERKPLNENQIKEFLATGMKIQDYWDYREGLSEYDTLEEKVDYIAGLDLPTHKKNMLVNNIADRKEAINLRNYDKYSSLEEMDFAIKYPEKYEVAQAIGGYAAYRGYQVGMKDMKLAEKADYIAGLNLTTEQKNLLINSETDRKEPIDLTGYENYSSFEEFEYAKKNPETYALAKAVGGYDSYTVYADALGDIKSDKDEWGQSINGSRKPKVYAYIYSLDIPEIEQHILFKSQYPSTDDHNYEIIDYLNQREDISYDEMVAILLGLDFKVSSDGSIRW